MKKILFGVAGVFLFMCGQISAQQKRLCGMEIEKAGMIARDPSWAAKFEAQRASLQTIADNYVKSTSENAAERSTSSGSTVPVVFHIIVTSAQFTQMGGYTGIAQRVDSQIVILNRDFNRQNPDSTLIPSCWKALYGNTGIHFGLAHTNPLGEGTPGYEIEITHTCGFSDVSASYSSAKHTATGGLDAWDVTKYYNVWCVNFVSDTTGCGSSSLLGLTVPLSFTGGWGAFPVAEEGVCIQYNALGNDGPSTGASYAPYNLGRTLTHETGHFFEIWHTWGDDGGLCPWNGGSDDGLSDTPPEADANYGNPVYSITCGTIPDACDSEGHTIEESIGIACISFMDYSDDGGMHLFTPMQAAAMASMVLSSYTGATGATGSGAVGENHPLVENPNLLNWPANTGVGAVQHNNNLTIFPNPTTGIVNLTFNGTSDHLNSIVVVDMLGQQVFNADLSAQQQNSYSVDLSAASKGIYFVKCNFVSGTEVRTVVLQ